MLIKKIILGIFVCSLVSACGSKDPLSQAIETYQDRLSSVLDIELTQSAAELSIPFPSRKSMSIDIPNIDMNLREFYGIESCPIKQLVAQRNTALGKIQLPSQRYKYEFALIEELQNCVLQINKIHEPTKAQMNELAITEQWLSAKQGYFALNWTNLITQSEELHLSLTQSGRFISGTQDDNVTAALIDLRYFLSLAASERSIDSSNLEDLENHLQSMAHHRFYAQLWRSMQLVRLNIDQLNIQLRTSLPQFECHSVSNKAEFNILQNVFNKYFIQGIQPIASAINNYHYQLSPLIQTMINHPDVPSALSQGLTFRNNLLFDDYQASLQSHIQIWQQFFSRCAISPKQIGANT